MSNAAIDVLFVLWPVASYIMTWFILPVFLYWLFLLAVKDL